VLRRLFRPGIIFSGIVLALVVAGCSSAPPRPPAAPPTVYVPLRVPAARVDPAEDYRIGQRDILAVRVLDLEKLNEISSIDVEVGARGEIALPFAGSVAASGRTAGEVREALVAALAAHVLVDPQVTVSVKEYHSHEVVVAGMVLKPGILNLNRNRVDLVQALSLAGGLAPEAGTLAYLIPAPRPGEAQPAPQAVDLVALLANATMTANPVVEPGAVIQVPRAEQFSVYGFVNRPGAFPFQRPTTVVEAIAMAGGFVERKASPSQVHITRKTAQGVERIDCDVDAIARGEAPNVALLPGDSVEAGRTIARAIYSEVVEVIIGRIGAGFSLGGPF
jgi:polysaccharide export outer membrane protein